MTGGRLVLEQKSKVGLMSASKLEVLNFESYMMQHPEFCLKQGGLSKRRNTMKQQWKLEKWV